MENIRKYLPWTLRILIFLLFVVSGITKMFPIWAFEKQLVDLGITNWCIAPYLSRLIIALEITLGIGMLQPHYIKRLIIPATIFLLAAFCVHLGIQMYQYGPMNGNCGCFGQLIPMTPLEAFIKNIITIAMLIYVYRTTTEMPPERHRIVYPLLISAGSALLMFMFFPFCPCGKETPAVITTSDSLSIEDQPLTISMPDTFSSKTATVPVKDTVKVVKKDTVKVATNEPKPTTSRFGDYAVFDNKKVNIDKGKKILCLFAPGCDHCQATAKELCAMSGKPGFPDVYILFMDEEADLVPKFFEVAQCRFPSRILEIPKFWTALGTGANTPGVFCLWNGNIVKEFEGIDKNKFNAEAMKKAFELK